MPVRSFEAVQAQLTEKATALLETGESLQRVIPAIYRTGPIRTRDAASNASARALVVTDKRIALWRYSNGLFGGLLTQPKFGRKVAEVPRSTMLDWFADGSWLECPTMGETIYIKDRFQVDLLATNTERQSPTS